MKKINSEAIRQFIIKYHKILFLLGLIIAITLPLINFYSPKTRKTKSPTFNQPNTYIYTPVREKKQEVFKITSTTPVDGAKNVDTGEIEISFETNIPIVSPKSFSMNISPTLPNYWKIISVYPTTKIKAQVYGTLTPDKQYTISVSDNYGLLIHTWRFTTSSELPHSSERLINDQEQHIIKSYYPLLDYIPYSGKNFYADYYDRLALVVVIVKGDKEQVKKEVYEWVRSKGVNPSSHTYKFEDP